MSSPLHALLVAEDFAGMKTQATALAERAAMVGHWRPVPPRPAGIWGWRLPGRGLLGRWGLGKAQRQWLDGLAAQQAALPPHQRWRCILAVGGRGGAMGLWVGKRLGLPVVAVQDPRRQRWRYRLIVACRHDGLPPSQAKAAGLGGGGAPRAAVTVVRTALHAVTPAKLRQAAQQGPWPARLAALKGGRRLLGVLLGGPNGRYRFGGAEGGALAAKLAQFMKRHDVACMVTWSRRTDKAALAALRAHLEPLGACFAGPPGGPGVQESQPGSQSAAHQQAPTPGANPYMAMLALCDALAVTVDSVSMISEAVATTRPVSLLALPGRSRRMERFHAMLARQGRVQPLLAQPYDFAPAQPLDDGALAATALLRALGAPPTSFPVPSHLLKAEHHG
ncbi:ELM1/GtrOC1 family putative glycosyltransferase [Formicincola oecophyllae]|nr:ELM1/GtrOC1 family putative glycosyltransferase [Formicincola oecophyllae]